jgi:hypothetical protein
MSGVRQVPESSDDRLRIDRGALVEQVGDQFMIQVATPVSDEAVVAIIDVSHPWAGRRQAIARDRYQLLNALEALQECVEGSDENPSDHASVRGVSTSRESVQ